MSITTRNYFSPLESEDRYTVGPSSKPIDVRSSESFSKDANAKFNEKNKEKILAIFSHYKTFTVKLKKIECPISILNSLSSLSDLKENYLVALLEVQNQLPESHLAIENLLKNCKIPTLKKLHPLFDWLISESQKNNSIQRTKELARILDCAAALNLDQPELFEQLSALPANKSFLWELIFKDVSFTSQIKLENLQKLFSSVKEESTYKKLFDSWRDSKVLVSLCKEMIAACPVIKTSFESWLYQSLRANGIMLAHKDNNLDSKIKLLPECYKKLLYKICLHNEKKIYWLSELFEFANNFPYPELIEKYFDICAKSTLKYFTQGREAIEHSSLQFQQQLFHNLAEGHPTLIPKFLSLLAQYNNPQETLTLQALAELQSKVYSPVFEYFVNKYTANVEKKNGSAYQFSSTLTDQNIKELRNQKCFSNFIKLIIYEKKNGISLFPIFAKTSLKNISKELLDKFRNDKKFALNFSWVNWTGPQLVRLNNLLKNEPDKLTNILEMTARFPKVFNIFFEEDKLGTATGNNSLVSQLYDALNQLKNNKSQNSINILLTAFESDEKELVYELIKILQSDRVLFDKLTDMLKSGAIAEIKQLIAIRSKAKKEPLDMVLLSLASSSNVSIIKAVIDLQNNSKEHPLLALFTKKTVSGQVDKHIKNLFVILARGQIEKASKLIEIAGMPPAAREIQENIAFQLLQDGYLDLAIECTIRKDSFFWNLITNFKLSKNQQQCYNFLIELQQSNLPKKIKDSIVYFAIFLSSQKKQKNVSLEWMSNLQYFLVHKKDQIIKKTSSDIWKQAIGQIKSKRDVKENTKKILELLPSKVEISKKFVDLTADKNSQLNNLTLDIANNLLSENGTINVCQIENIKKSALYKSFDANSSEMKYIERVLSALKNDSDFNDRLAVLKAPPKDSKQGRLIQAILNYNENANLTDRDTRLAALSALLWPLRQGESGSCFSTSILIQLDSSIEGLKQSLEDYIAILSKGFLTRNKVKFPIIFEEKSYKDKFKGDHFLSRVRESTVASMAANKETYQHLVKSFKELFSNKISMLKKINLSKELVKFESNQNEFFEYFEKNLIAFSQLLYLSHERHPDADFIGAWKLVDIEEDKIISTSPEALHSLIEKSFKKSLENLKEKIGFEKETLNLLSDIMQGLINSNGYIEKLFSNLAALGYKNKGLSSVNPIKYYHLVANSPISQFYGGFPTKLLEIYHERKILPFSLYNDDHPLNSLTSFSRMLSSSQSKETQRNPNFLIPMTTPSHAFNLKISTLAQNNLKNLSDSIKYQNDETNTTVLQPVEQWNIVNALSNSFNNEKKTLFTNLFKKIINGNNYPLNFMADQILYASNMITGDMKNQSQMESNISKIIRSNSLFRETRPGMLVIGDTNWNENSLIGYGYSLKNNNHQPIFISKDSKIHNQSWFPEPISDWQIFIFQSCSDPLLRKYS